MLNETFNIVQKVYNTKTGKNPLLVYVDPKTSTDNAFEQKDTFKEYGMEYLPSKLGKYAPHAWGWILWNGENDKQMAMVKKFVNDLPNIEQAPEGGQTRGFNDITANLEPVVQEMLKSIEAAEKIQPKNAQDASTKEKIEQFKNMLQNELGNEKTQEFIKNLIAYRTELRKHNAYNLGWTNVMLAWFARNGKATQIRPIKEWEKMGYQPKEGIEPICLLGKGCKHKPYTQEEKAKIIQSYLDEKGVNSIEELPQSSQYDLKNRKLKGKIIPGTEYQFGYAAYDVQDVEPIPGVDIEKEPEEPEENWWWSKLPEDQKDIALTTALIKFAESNECGNIKVNVDNSQQGLGGARGNATAAGEINLINDGKVRFPTAVHELTHQLRHWAFASSNNPALKRFFNRFQGRDIREQEAELCSAFVSSMYGYDIQHSLNYVFNWGLSKENCNKVFDQIAEVADFIEKGINKYMDNSEENNK
jgi:hypothetical protein